MVNVLREHGVSDIVFTRRAGRHAAGGEAARSVQARHRRRIADHQGEVLMLYAARVRAGGNRDQPATARGAWWWAIATISLHRLTSGGGRGVIRS
ncbi:hypothetical protein M8494_15100 [Serratia ureilytica]